MELFFIVRFIGIIVPPWILSQRQPGHENKSYINRIKGADIPSDLCISLQLLKKYAIADENLLFCLPAAIRKSELCTG